MHRRVSPISRTLSLVLAGALVLAACGSDDEEPNASSDTDASSDDTSQSSGDCELSEPVKLAFAWEVQGDSDVAVNDYQNGAQLALDEINAAGGVCGQEIVAEQISTSTTDPQAAVASYLEAVDTEPVAILGLNSQPVIDAALSQIERNQIPTITLSPNDKAIYGTDTGTEFLWLAPARSSELAAGAARFVVDDLGFTDLGFLGTNESFGNDALAAIEPVVEEAGADLSVVRQSPPGVTDLTAEVLDMEGVEAIFDFGYPNDIALALKQLAQNGIDVPVIDGASADIVALYGMAEPDALENLYASVDCTANATDRPAMADFAAAYQAEYSSLPFAYGVIAYDMVHFVAEAVEAAGSADPLAVNEAIGSITYEGGACHPAYEADGAHTLAHSGVVVKFQGDGSAVVQTELEFEPLEEGGSR